MNDCFRLLNEKKVLSIEDYFSGANLSESQKSLIDNRNDLWKISFIGNLPAENQDTIGRSFSIKKNSWKHYAKAHRDWLSSEKYYLGNKLSHEPNSEEFHDDMQKTHVCERFRLFYILTYPERVSMLDEIPWNSFAYAFLEKAEKISGENYLCFLSNGSAQPDKISV